MTGPTVLVVSDEEAGRRIDVALAARFDESRSQAAARIDRGEVRVDGRVVARSHKLQAGSRIEVTSPPEEERGAAGVPVPPIRYEDEHVLVIAKPPGLVVHPGTGRPAGTLVQALAEHGVPLAPAGGSLRPGIVHRLDRDTSGLMVVAKTDAAYHGLVAALKARAVTRRYLALVEGRLPAARGRIEAPIGRDPRDRKRFAPLPDGKPATTRFEVVATGTVPGIDAERGTVSLVACELETGRTHQIRVHLRHAGCAVVGDPVYGGKGQVAAALGVERLFLHAGSLRFAHPVTGEEIAVEEPLPTDLAVALERAGIAPAG